MPYDPPSNAWNEFKASGGKCYFCFLEWQKYENGHIHPDNVGWVECNADKQSPPTVRVNEP